MPKFEPLIVTEVAIGPLRGVRLVIDGVIVKGAVLLFTPATVTKRLVVVALAAPLGTVATMVVALQLVGVACAKPIVTVLVPWDEPKSVPVIVTEVPTGPKLGLTLVIDGLTTKRKELLANPFTVTCKVAFPAANPVGTVATILVELQLETVATRPLNVTVLVPWDPPKFAPLIVMAVPIGPELGMKLEMLGGIVTVNAAPLLGTPPKVTTTLPLVAPLGTGTAMLEALQLVGAAAVPLKVTVLVPCDAPKFEPLIITEVPTGPEVGLRLAMLGAATPPAGLKAARRAAQLLEGLSVAVAAAVPAVGWI